MMNPDGSEQVNLTQHPAIDQSAVWSPTGEQILFVSDRGGVRDLYLMDADGTNVRRVFKKKIRAWRKNATWSPDGKQFAYNYEDWNRIEFGMYLGTFGEEDVERLPNGRSPAWSPDGTEIAYTTSHALGSRLIFLNVDTRAQEQPLPDKALRWQHSPAWSAAGDRLAISGNKHPIPAILDRDLHEAWKTKTTVYIVNRDGTGLRQLVEEAGPNAIVLDLSPDGSEVLYVQEINGHTQIFKIDVNTGVQTQLTHVDGPFRQTNTGGDWFDPAYALPVSPQPHLLTTTWGKVKKQ
jgi:TolB protein